MTSFDKASLKQFQARLAKRRQQKLTEAREWPPADYLIKRFVHAGLPCAIARGTFSVNGYVCVPVTHPDANKTDDEVDVDVHGGLTFFQRALNGGMWFGFDTAHYDDMAIIPQTGMVLEGRIWTAEDVEQETRHLAEQLVARATGGLP